MQLLFRFSTAIRASSLLAMMSLMIAMTLGVSVVSAQGTYCTEHDESQWHPAVDPVTGCWYGHEHGDNPMPAGTPFEPLTFGGDEATPHENVYKHNGYKVFYLHRNNGNAMQDNGDPCDDLRVRIHMDVTPAARRGQYHSYEVDVAHCAGGQLDVSHLQGWIDFGTVVNLSTREGGDNGVRPNKFAPSENDFNQNGLNIWEVWYGRTALGIDMGWMMGEVPTVDHNGSNPDDPSTWVWTGGVGRKRKLENFNFYGWRETQRGEYWTDPLGSIVDPNSQFCQTNQCLRQYISPLFGTSQSDQIILLYNGHHEYNTTGVNFPATHPLVGDLPWLDNGSDPDPVPQPEPPIGPAVFFQVDDSNPDSVNVNVQLIGVSGVYGLEAQCAVDPAILQGTTMVPGDGFNDSNSFIIDSGFQADGIWNIAASRLNPAPPLDGNALGFTFQYNVLTTGDGQLTCAALVVDDNGNPITIEIVNGVVLVLPESEPPVVEPPVVEPPAVETGVLAGLVTYQNRPDNGGITVKILGVNDTPLVELVTGPDGAFAFPDLAIGSYKLQFIAPQHIPVVNDVLLDTADATTQINGQLRAGDIDDNGVVDMADVTLVGANFGTTTIPQISHIDLNADGLINISDLSLVGGNFDLVSPLLTP